MVLCLRAIFKAQLLKYVRTVVYGFVFTSAPFVNDGF